MSLDIPEIDRLLRKQYGNKILRPHRDAIGELVRTILSQNTSDVNRDVAYERLRLRFPDWDDLLSAQTSSIKAAIKPGGLAGIKAPRLKKILREIRQETGAIDLSHLEIMPLRQAVDYLRAFNGVGPKTAACVLLFSYGRKIFPVDTHIYRVSQRLGLIPSECGREMAHEILNKSVPPRLHYRFHLNLIELGRIVCRSRKPRCAECVLSESCPSASSEVS